MPKHTEQEWAQIITTEWETFNNEWITKEDILNNPSILRYINSDDLVMSGSRNEEQYKQQIGNLVSHRNSIFYFRNDGLRILFRPKILSAGNASLSFDDGLLAQIDSSSINAATNAAQALLSRPTTAPQDNLVRMVRRWASSYSLKELVKIANNYSCQLGCDMNLQSFNVNGHHYVEAHHIIPMSNQDAFPIFNLDVVDNLVTLCPKCHRRIHLVSDIERSAMLEQIRLLKPNIFTELNLSVEEVSELY